MVFQPPLAEYSKDRPFDALDEEALEHLLDVVGSASKRLFPLFLGVFGRHQTFSFKGLYVSAYCCNFFIRRVLLEEIVDDSVIRR